MSGFTSLGLNVCRLKRHIVNSLATLHIHKTATFIPPTHHCTVRTVQLKGLTSDKLFKKKKSGVCVLSACMSAYHVCLPGASRGQKRVPDSLEFELQIVGSHCVWWELNPVPREE